MVLRAGPNGSKWEAGDLRMKLFHLGFALMLALGANPSAADITVYKTKTCGCCGKWVEHLRANGFKVTVNEVPAMTE